MRRIFLAAAALPLVCPVSAAAQSIPCAEFNKNVQTLDGKWEQASDASGMGLSMGFLLGYFVAKRGERLEDFQEKEFSIYLQDVVNRCTSNPTKHVMMVAMEAAVPAPSEQKNTAEIDLIDLKLDIGKMSGREVVVHGTISVLGDLAMLGDGGFDTTPVPVDIGKLSRDDRKKVLQSCNMQCGVTITGKIGPFMMQKGIIARSIELD
ncbi:MAG: hypothetical protein J0H80_00890 [Rhizobiales bacterium]|nr:hypothetical protein [Hyphomicrobiales bacterium]